VTTTEPDQTPAAEPPAAGKLMAGGRPQRKSRRVRLGLEWLAVVLVALLAALGIKTWLLQAFVIPSGSMIPTLDIGDRILVNKVSYDVHAVHRGDIVVFSTPPNDTGDAAIKDLVKRVIGLPGDRISSANGHVYIDGRLLQEPYLPRGTTTVGIPPQTIPPGHYFVMGDNRSDSKDSRFFGPIPGKLIVGRAILRVWPINRIAIL
jgi:signal peptidase I